MISKFSSTSFSNFNIRTNNFDELADRLNQHLFSKISSNFAVIDTDKVIAANGINKSINNRDYYSSKSLYTIDYFKAYTEYVAPYFISANGKSKKILILDCDNTLWKGILGENGFDNIEMSKSTKDGSIFSEIQSIILSLHKQGILLWNMLHSVIAIYEKQHPNWVFIRFEDLAVNPIIGYSHLFNQLKLSFNKNIQNKINLLSSNENPIELPLGKRDTNKRNSIATMYNWKTRLTQEEIQLIKKGVNLISEKWYPTEDWE